MAEEDKATNEESEGTEEAQEEHKCEECAPGLPAWMATFSDLVTLLLTFFVLLLSFAKTETAKYESALGSIRNAFGGNNFKQGEVFQLGKSPDNQPTLLETPNPISPFPIDFLTVEGFLDKHEVNRESAEELAEIKESLLEFQLADNSDIYEMPEGVKTHIRDKIYFEKGSTEFSGINVEVFKNLVKIMRTGKWSLFVQGHSERGEKSQSGRSDAFGLSASRVRKVIDALVERGVHPKKITGVFYGDSRPNKGDRDEAPAHLNRRVDFILRKIDLNERGHRVDARRP
ncbi:MAG: OmpA family protein [Bacteriovoracales bacterium]|nr:OmpA family protein [Bacteriovoracales bacterium]